MQGGKLVLVTKTADCFRATVRVLRSVDASKGMAFHTYSLPEDGCTRLLVKGLGKNMPEQDAREELEILEIPVQSVLQLRSQRREPDPAKDRFPIPHFIVMVARVPLVSKVPSLTSLCGLRVKVERYQAPKGPIPCKNCSASVTRSVIVVIPRSAWPVVAHTFRMISALLQRNRRGALTVMPTTLLTIVVAVEVEGLQGHQL